jgi:DnaK suppressor protein
MTADWNEFKSMLEAKRDEVLRRLRKLEDISVERAPDPVDEMEMTAEREAAITLLERDSELLRQIGAALQRIEEGDFGRCALCGKEIRLNRLRAVPWATYCVACQDEVDRSGTREASALSAAQV